MSSKGKPKAKAAPPPKKTKQPKKQSATTSKALVKVAPSVRFSEASTGILSDPYDVSEGKTTLTKRDENSLTLTASRCSTTTAYSDNAAKADSVIRASWIPPKDRILKTDGAVFADSRGIYSGTRKVRLRVENLLDDTIHLRGSFPMQEPHSAGVCSARGFTRNDSIAPGREVVLSINLDGKFPEFEMLETKVTVPGAEGTLEETRKYMAKVLYDFCVLIPAISRIANAAYSDSIPVATVTFEVEYDVNRDMTKGATIETVEPICIQSSSKFESIYQVTPELVPATGTAASVLWTNVETTSFPYLTVEWVQRGDQKALKLVHMNYHKESENVEMIQYQTAEMRIQVLGLTWPRYYQSGTPTGPREGSKDKWPGMVSQDYYVQSGEFLFDEAAGCWLLANGHEVYVDNPPCQPVYPVWVSAGTPVAVYKSSILPSQAYSQRIPKGKFKTALFKDYGLENGGWTDTVQAVINVITDIIGIGAALGFI